MTSVSDAVAELRKAVTWIYVQGGCDLGGPEHQAADAACAALDTLERELFAGTHYESNGEAGDGQTVCDECGHDADEPHPLRRCVAALKAHEAALERELAEKTARVADLERQVACWVERIIDLEATLETTLAARPALELPTRDELARFLSQETEGDAWDDPLHDEHQERFRNAWRKKANRILAFLAPKPPEGRSDD
jgi:hypothetical protein